MNACVELPCTPEPERWHELVLIARGATRVAVVDPVDVDACLKFELDPESRTPASLRERLRRWTGRAFPEFGDNATELAAYRRLHARLGARLHAHIAAVDCAVDTAWGPALRTRRVRHADGSAAESLFQLMGDHALPVERACEAIDVFAGWLIAHRIPLFDLNAGNLLLVRDAVAMRIVCIDCKSTRSSKEIIPVSRWIPALMRRKILRRAQRLKQRLRASPD